MTHKGPQKDPTHPQPGKDDTSKQTVKKIVSPGDISDQDPKRRIGHFGGTGEPHAKENM